MRKLLSSLATLLIAGTSATSMIACSAPVTSVSIKVNGDSNIAADDTDYNSSGMITELSYNVLSLINFMSNVHTNDGVSLPKNIANLPLSTNTMRDKLTGDKNANQEVWTDFYSDWSSAKDYSFSDISASADSMTDKSGVTKPGINFERALIDPSSPAKNTEPKYSTNTASASSAFAADVYDYQFAVLGEQLLTEGDETTFTFVDKSDDPDYATSNNLQEFKEAGNEVPYSYGTEQYSDAYGTAYYKTKVEGATFEFTFKGSQNYKITLPIDGLYLVWTTGIAPLGANANIQTLFTGPVQYQFNGDTVASSDGTGRMNTFFTSLNDNSFDNIDITIV